MKKIIVSLLALILLTPSAGALAATASSGTYVQNTAMDATGDAAGMDSSLDLIQGRLEIDSENNFKFWLLTAQKPASVASAMYYLNIDTNLDGVKDYLIAADASLIDSTLKDAEVFNWATEQDETCDAKVSTGSLLGKPAVIFDISRDCLPVGPKLNVRFTSLVQLSDTQTNYDFVPSQDTFQTFNTDFMAGQTCKAAKNGARISYLGKAFICQKTGNAWKFVDYGQVLAKKAKYATDKAYYTCLYSKVGASLADGNKTLQIDAIGKYFITFSDFDCVKRVMAVPTWLSSQIGITRALDGMQKATFGQYIATWTYHPDNGLNIVIRKK